MSRMTLATHGVLRRLRRAGRPLAAQPTRTLQAAAAAAATTASHVQCAGSAAAHAQRRRALWTCTLATCGVLAAQAKPTIAFRTFATPSKPADADETAISLLLQEIHRQEREFAGKVEKSSDGGGGSGGGGGVGLDHLRKLNASHLEDNVKLEMLRGAEGGALPPAIPIQSDVDAGTELRPQRTLLLDANRLLSAAAASGSGGGGVGVAGRPAASSTPPRITYPKHAEKLQVNFKTPPPPPPPLISSSAPEVDVAERGRMPPSGARFLESTTQRVKTLLDSSTRHAEVEAMSRMLSVGSRPQGAQPPLPPPPSPPPPHAGRQHAARPPGSATTSITTPKEARLSKLPLDGRGDPLPPESKLITSILTQHDLGVVSVVAGRLRSAAHPAPPSPSPQEAGGVPQVAEGATGGSGGGGGGSDGEQAKGRRWVRVKYTMGLFGLVSGVFGGYLLLYIGAPKHDAAGALILDKYSHLPTVVQYAYRISDELENYNKMIKEPSRSKLLPDVLEPPYYQPPYTLVLEFTDLLVHPEWTYQSGWRFKKRPGVDQFLEALYTRFEVVVYTAQMGMTVFPIMEALDSKNLISYKLVRDATNFIEGDHVKDLDKINRDLSKVVVVDWNPASVKLHAHNLFRIPRWDGNDDDTTLFDLAAFLIAISEWEVQDVRAVLQYYAQFESPLGKFKENQMQALQATQG